MRLPSGLSPRSMSDHVPVISYAAEVRRKALHLMALAIPVGILLFGREVSLWVLVPLAALALLADWSRQRIEWARDVLLKVFGSLMRPEEIPPFGERLVFNGATMMCVAAALCVALFAPVVAAAAMAMQMIGDAAAALVGRRIGRTRLFGSPKSLEGTLAFIATAALMGWAFSLWPGVQPLVDANRRRRRRGRTRGGAADPGQRQPAGASGGGRSDVGGGALGRTGGWGLGTGVPLAPEARAWRRGAGVAKRRGRGEEARAWRRGAGVAKRRGRGEEARLPPASLARWSRSCPPQRGGQFHTGSLQNPDDGGWRRQDLDLDCPP